MKNIKIGRKAVFFIVNVGMTLPNCFDFNPKLLYHIEPKLIEDDNLYKFILKKYLEIWIKIGNYLYISDGEYYCKIPYNSIGLSTSMFEPKPRIILNRDKYNFYRKLDRQTDFPMYSKRFYKLLWDTQWYWYGVDRGRELRKDFRM